MKQKCSQLKKKRKYIKEKKNSLNTFILDTNNGNIDATIIMEEQKYVVGQSFFVPKFYLIKIRYLARILQNDRPRRSLF